MIVVKLMGGLGNQMFQYALGRSLAERHGTELKMDLSFLLDRTVRPNFTCRNYELGVFQVKESFASAEDLQSFPPSPQRSRLARLFKLLGGGSPGRISERHFHFDAAVLDSPVPCYLEGYWQSEKYFAEIAPLLRADFALRQEPQGLNREVASAITGCEAVSVHIRRGDYVADAKVAAKYAACGGRYFTRAAELMLARVARPHFFVFSDDPDWVRQHFSIPHATTLVQHNGPDQAQEDLRLMSLCRHHIIANSTFSWWGAWLDPRPDKIVVAPQSWFNDPAIDTGDLMPASWLRLPV